MANPALATDSAASINQSGLKNYFGQWAKAWDRFWFTPKVPTTLGLMRILTGLIVFYSQLVWSGELMTFFGPEGMLPASYRELYFQSKAWSHFDWVSGSTSMWVIHWAGLVVAALFTLGVQTRITSILTTALVISYANRATGALFGLDQLMVMLCLYLSLGNSGGAFSFDRWWQMRTGQGRGAPRLRWSGTDSPDVLTTIATRLVQLHLCVIYFYAGLGKLQGETWWNGQAIWFSVASYEYQTLDLTWMADQMGLVAFLTLVTVYWEVTYPALVWSRLTRPLVLLIAVLTHIGIGLAMGMMTFGLIMLVANLSFLDFPCRRESRDGEESDAINEAAAPA